MSRGLQLLGAGAGFLLAVYTVVLGLDLAHIPAPATIAVDVAERTLQQIEAVRGFVRPNVREVVLIGNEATMAYPKGATIGERLGGSLNSGAKPHVNVLDLTMHGMSTFTAYAFASRIADMNPDGIVVEFNLAALSRAWNERHAHLELLAWLQRRDLGEAIQDPLYWWGARLEEILSYQALVKLKQVDRWASYRRTQIRTSIGLRRLRLAAQNDSDAIYLPNSGLPPTPSPYTHIEPHYFIRNALEELYGPAMAGVTARYPVLRLLSRIVEKFSTHGIRTLVYTTPLNVEYLAHLGLLDKRGLNVTLSTMRSVVEQSGGSFLDIHDLFPTTAFRDADDHLRYSSQYDGPALIAAKLAQAIRPQIQRH